MKLHIAPLSALAVALLATPVVLAAPAGAVPTGAASADAAGDAAGDAAVLGRITAATTDNAHQVTFTAGTAKLRVTSTDARTVHVELAPHGTFTDPDAAPPKAGDPDAKMIPAAPRPAGKLLLSDTGSTYTLRMNSTVLTITKNNPRMQLARTDGTVLWRETAPLSWSADDGTTQTLAAGSKEQFYGGGEQNGAYNHTGRTIQVANSFNWNEGGYNNSQPYYVSSAGYGVFRHTFAPGTYDFGASKRGTLTTTEQEQRFDAYYFVGDLKQSVDAYTDLVGKPFMPPVYGLEPGDSDCYLHNANRGERHTLDAVDVAKGYTDNGMPNGWMLVNDGYGCGYENLKQTAQGLAGHNMKTGLWTQNGLANLPQETKDGVVVRKLDVAWVGPGYRFALDGCQTAYDGIEQYSSSRGFVWQPNSWAGAQRCAVLWSGDQSGSWDYIRWQIPTYAAAAVSGIAYSTGDVDGIFGGSPDTYTRDLQWKAMLPAVMTMDGWASSDKQPWRYDAAHNAINREYLLLKERLIPYSYTYSHQAHQTGLGQVRPLYVEYPNDPMASSDAAKQEFLSGKDFLVAPVYSDTSVRNGIYLPAGTWVDYWTGRTYTGPTTINGYRAPLDTLPMFVRGGAVVPMWPNGTTSYQTRDKSQLDVDVYPQGRSSFDLYEDDGVTRSFAQGASSSQTLSVSAPKAGRGTVEVTVGRTTGTYTGQVAARRYNLSVHTPVAPSQVQIAGRTVDHVNDADALSRAAQGWYYDARAAVVHVKTPKVSRDNSLLVRLLDTSAVVNKRDASGATVSFRAPATITPGASLTIPVTFRNSTEQTVRDVQVTLAASTSGVSGGSRYINTALAPGQSATVRIPVQVAADAQSGRTLLTATAGYTSGSGTYRTDFSAGTVVPYASVADTFDNNGVTDKAGYAGGDLDGSGDSLSSEALATAGLSPGKQFTQDGITYTWPDVPAAADDNVAAGGQTIALSGRGNSLGILGTGIGSDAGGQLTVTYADGSTDTQKTGLPNWCCLATDSYGAKIAYSAKGRNTPTGLGNTTTDYRVYTNTVRLDPGKDVVAVTLPSQSGIHVFDVAIGSAQLPAPPGAGDTWISDLTPMASTNGWGPVEKDMSNGESAAGDGRPLTLAGTVYPKGLGTNSPSAVSFNLGGKCTRFTTTVGIDDEIGDYGSAVFTVVVDGRTVQVSPQMTGTSAPVQLSADVSGAQYLDLVVSSDDGASGDHGDWAGARVTCTG